MSALRLPIVAQVTIDEDGNCLDGSDPQTFVSEARRVGRGCHWLQLQRRSGGHAGRDGESAGCDFPATCGPAECGHSPIGGGRNIYLCSPEYMASYARKFVAAGVRLVGGCCGTTPEHIRVMKSALRVGEARGKAVASAHVAGGQAAPLAVPAVPLESRSLLGEKLARGEFVTMVEIVPPKGIDVAEGSRGGAVSEVGGRGCGQHSGQPSGIGAHEQPGAVAADSARGRHRRDSALHLPRSQCAVHSERSAGSGGGGDRESDLYHR